MASSANSSDGKYQVELVRKRRELPLPGDVLVKVGDTVEPETMVAKISLKPGIPWVIPASRLLGCDPAEVPGAMIKKIGDICEHKEIIAVAEKGIYGRKELEAPTGGVIEDASGKSGRIVIREEFGREEPPMQVDVAFDLGCKPSEVRQNLLRREGQEIKRGAMLAKKGQQGAFYTRTCLSPISGVITDVDDRTGLVTIARPFKEVVVKGYISGTIAEIIPQRGVIISTPAVSLTGVFGLGSEAHGDIAVLVDDANQILEADAITKEHAEKIIVGGSFVTNEALQKALEVGVAGVVTGTASYFNLVDSLGVKLGIGITGQENIGMTVILMEGFGTLAMRDHAWQTLKALEGKRASINGATQIRAGAIRPEIIVPFPDYKGELMEPEAIDEELSLGQRVRIISDPYFGAVGTIDDVPREPGRVESESLVPIVKVALESGEKVLVPRQNVEVW